MNRTTYLALSLVLTSLAFACSSGDDDGDPNTQGQTQNSTLKCIAGEMHPCACLGQTVMGMQTCNATGTGYAACTGCPPPPAQTSGSGGVNASGSGGNPGMTVVDAGKPTTPKPDAGKPDASLHEDSSVSLPVGAEPGVSCGVGLPALCELQTQKCCVRSLETDSCIAADAMCDCAINGCNVMEARCDGPEDCAMGQVCCGTLNGNGNGYQSFVCAATCQSNGNQRQACHGDETPCPTGMVCANSQLLTNVQVCIDPASIDQ